MRRGQIALILVNPDMKPWESDRVALMELYEGTRCWQLVDVRLATYRAPGQYMNASADDYHAMYKPDTPENATEVRTMLHEYTEDTDGTFHWCSFEGIVRGHPTIDGYRPSWHLTDQAGYFKRSEGLALMKEMQAWWEAYDGDPKLAKIDNPNRQMIETRIMSHFIMKDILAKHPKK